MPSDEREEDVQVAREWEMHDERAQPPTLKFFPSQLVAVNKHAE
jgi:hypothetical protein